MTAAAVAAKLGGRKVLGRQIRSEIDLAAAVRDGLPVEALEALLRALGWRGPRQEIVGLVGSVRTLQRKREADSALSAGESDRLARVARLLVRAEEVLGSTDKARDWLSEPNRALGGERPVMLLDSDAGALAVEQVLGRIEHGVFS